MFDIDNFSFGDDASDPPDKTDLEKFLKGDHIKTEDPLGWWMDEGRRLYPTAYPLARDILTVSATSIDVERVFSRGHIALTHVRNRLGAASTRAILCLGPWCNLDLVGETDMKTSRAERDAGKASEDEGETSDEEDKWTALFSDIV